MTRTIPDTLDPTAKIVRRITRDGAIDRVEVHARERGAIAYALPSSTHPLVLQRIKAAAGEAGTLAEIERVYAEAGRPVMTARGPTILAALELLEAELKQ